MKLKLSFDLGLPLAEIDQMDADDYARYQAWYSIYPSKTERIEAHLTQLTYYVVIATGTKAKYEDFIIDWMKESRPTLDPAIQQQIDIIKWRKLAAQTKGNIQNITPDTLNTGTVNNGDT